MRWRSSNFTWVELEIYRVSSTPITLVSYRTRNEDRRSGVWYETARELIQFFEAHLGEPKGVLEDAIDELTVDNADYKIIPGLAKLL